MLMMWKARPKSRGGGEYRTGLSDQSRDRGKGCAGVKISSSRLLLCLFRSFLNLVPAIQTVLFRFEQIIERSERTLILQTVEESSVTIIKSDFI